MNKINNNSTPRCAHGMQLGTCSICSNTATPISATNTTNNTGKISNDSPAVTAISSKAKITQTTFSATLSTKITGSTCPHGASLSSCPICKGSGGGGGGGLHTRNKPGEMTYSEGYAIWMQIKAARNRVLSNILHFAQKEKAEATQKQINENVLQKTPMLKILANNINGVLAKIKISPAIPQEKNSTINNLANLANLTNLVKTNFMQVIHQISSQILSVINRAGEIIADKIRKINDFFENNAKKFKELLRKTKEFFEFTAVKKAIGRVKNYISSIFKRKRNKKRNKK